MSESFTVLQKVIEYQFNDPDLLREAMTHKSYASEWNIKYDNQRLEFFGDAVVQLVLTNHLFFRFPLLQEGDLTKIRSALVNQTMLAGFARSLSLGKYLRLGQGEMELNGGDRDSTISDAFEALSGAIYLDGGYEKAERFILRVFQANVKDPLKLLQELNPKGALQELTQAQFGKTPVYAVLSVSGPQHEPVYEVSVTVGHELLGTGTAQNRKNAEQAAAQQALEVLKKRKKESGS